ncbi:MAG: hypothetical protein A2451_02565 [Bdellovibrionales bacterium RIFOXYC2_FULL_39_8]|nr:MAG: hypothetical protein A2404_07960 [Bdellovibrionales bacterium RIFOXYC1_FULL_39_130]OFZ73927.1 MAG: hypothetical protein A2451_02565 [Bdellovibrionales bacterium RIFOXYC2_FULL_39_8]
MFIETLHGENVEYGWIDSHLFAEDKASTDAKGIENKTVKIFYLIRKANHQNAPYLIFFNGGPGIAFSEIFHAHNYKTFLPDINVVFMDQRGNGLSDKPGSDLHELKYYSAKYISYDAEMVRKKIVGDKAKWIVFGQSYGGVVARKYLELYPESILIALTHGSAKYSAVNVAAYTEKNTSKRINEYFEKYPNDLKLIESLKSNLRPSDYVSTIDYRLSGKSIIDLLYIFYAIYPDEKMHDLYNSIDSNNSTNSFLEKIKPLAETLLKTGNLGSAIAYIDLCDGKTEKEITAEAIRELESKNFYYKEQLISKIRLSDNLETISDEARGLDKLLESNNFKSDSTNWEKIAANLKTYHFQFHVYGSSNDALAFDSVKDEEKFAKSIHSDSWHFHYSDGNHREWLVNKDLFNKILSPYVSKKK